MLTSGIIKNGTVFTYDGNEPVCTDVLLKDGRVAAIGNNLDGDQLFDANGDFVTPALTDLHTHIYWGATALSVKSEDHAIQSAVGTFVDAGSSGAGNVLGFEEFIKKPSRLNIFAFLNVSFPGIFGFSKDVMVGEAEDMRLLSKDACVRAVSLHKDTIVGLKVRAGKLAAGENGEKALNIALEWSEELDLPLMCHVDFSPPDIEYTLNRLRPGDIITHCCRPDPNSIIDDNRVIDAAHQAKERGVVFDIGHGMGGFSFDVCAKALADGLAPDVISSDIHCISVNGPAYDLLTTINKLIALGMSVESALAAVTKNPCKIIKRPELGRIRVGDIANISILRPTEEKAELVDATGAILIGDNMLLPAGLIAGGQEIFLENRKGQKYVYV